MSGDSLTLTDGSDQTRPALGDLTNRVLKRGFSALSSDSARKSEDGAGDLPSAKQLCLGVSEIVGVGKDSSLLLRKNKQPCRSSSPSSETDASLENTGPAPSNLNTELKSCLFVELDGSRDSSFSSVPLDSCSDMWNSSCPLPDEELTQGSGRGARQCKLVKEQRPLVTVCKDGDKGLGFSGLFPKTPSFVECVRLPEQGSESHEIRRCINLSVRADNVGDDVLKTCSCSFCLKAAYIWSDLHYQDIKGRLSAIKKSQKEANTLALKNSKDKESGAGAHGNPAKLSKLESDLSNQWKSLFFHMEGVLVAESNQLQANFNALKELRENCKIDLEMINRKR